MRELLRRLKHWLHRDEFERELEEEMRHHLALSAEDRGDNRAANLRLGNMTLLKEDSRAMWTWTYWEQFLQDLRYGFRTMAANPLFTAMAVVSLALGIGANTAIFSFMDAILLRTLPVRDPKELVVLNWRAKGNPGVIHGVTGSMHSDGGTGRSSPNFPFPAFQTLRANPDVLSDVFAYAFGQRLNVVAQQQADFAEGMYVSGGFYAGLGVTPAVGRLIGDDDDRTGAPPVSVLSYAYWQRRFNGNPGVVGQSILLNNISFTIAGVSSPEFFGVNPGEQKDVYVPLHALPLLSSGDHTEQQSFFDRNYYWVEMMGRLRPGVSRQRAELVLAARFQQYAGSTAATKKDREEFPALWLEDGAGGLDSLRRQYSKPLAVLMVMVGLILTIACANIASLMLARATARTREIAVRLSMGAGRMRIIRQLLTESVLLSLMGGLLGLLVAMWGIRSLTWLLANGQERFTLNASLNWQVLLFTLALAVLAGALFGLAPALQSTRVDLTSALKEVRAAEGRGRSGAFGLAHVLVTAQIGLSLLLVVGAGLFVRTVSNLHSINLGFNQENLLLFSLDARQAGYREGALAQFYADLLARFRLVPGVKSAGLSQFSLVAHYWNSTSIRIPGTQLEAGKEPETCFLPVDADFLATMQIPILMGRGLEERDLVSPRVAVVTEVFVKKFFPNQNPVGRRFGLGDKKSPADIEIVGVARTALYNSVKEKETPPLVYIPYTQNLQDLSGVVFELRAGGDPLSLVSTVRKIVHEASPNVPLADVKTQAAQIDQTISEERTFAQLCSGFAVLALMIACVGLYGTMAYTIARRTSEIGVRMALGATRKRIVWMVLREVLGLTSVGVVAGLGAAWATTRLVESYLFGLKQHDPTVLAGAVLVLLFAVVAAGFSPAWRAARIDPMIALRHE